MFTRPLCNTCLQGSPISSVSSVWWVPCLRKNPSQGMLHWGGLNCDGLDCNNGALHLDSILDSDLTRVSQDSSQLKLVQPLQRPQVCNLAATKLQYDAMHLRLGCCFFFVLCLLLLPLLLFCSVLFCFAPSGKRFGASRRCYRLDESSPRVGPAKRVRRKRCYMTALCT